MGKKVGVSPFIAGFFLILIAIVLGSVLASQLKEPVRVAPVKLNSEKVCGPAVDYLIPTQETKLACFNYNEETKQGELQFVIKNNGQPISAIHLRALTDLWIFEDDIEEGIAMHDSQLLSYYYDYEEYGSLMQIKIWPVIETATEKNICSDKAIILHPSNLDECPLKW